MNLSAVQVYRVLERARKKLRNVVESEPELLK